MCNIKFELNTKEYVISIVPYAIGVVLWYRDLALKCETLEDYENVMSWLLENIFDENVGDVMFAIEYEDYNPHMDPTYGEIQINVSRFERVVFTWNFDLKIKNDTVLKKLLPLFYTTYVN